MHKNILLLIILLGAKLGRYEINKWMWSILYYPNNMIFDIIYCMIVSFIAVHTLTSLLVRTLRWSNLTWAWQRNFNAVAKILWLRILRLFSYYMMLSLSVREGKKDPRTNGQLFYLIYDDMGDIRFALAFDNYFWNCKFNTGLRKSFYRPANKRFL